jgi:hypothetical protein
VQVCTGSWYGKVRQALEIAAVRSFGKTTAQQPYAAQLPYFFLCLFFLKRFLRLWVAILCLFFFFPLGMMIIPLKDRFT